MQLTYYVKIKIRNMYMQICDELEKILMLQRKKIYLFFIEKLLIKHIVGHLKVKFLASYLHTDTYIFTHIHTHTHT